MIRELQQRLYNWTTPDQANNVGKDNVSTTTTSLLLELYHRCEGSNKELLFLSELQVRGWPATVGQLLLS